MVFSATARRLAPLHFHERRDDFMKSKLCVLAAFLCALSVTAYAQTTFLYLNFDQATDGVYADSAAYSFGASEIANGTAVGIGALTAIYRNNAGDGPQIGAAPGGISGTAQGGKVLLTNSGSGQDEGLQIIAPNGLAPQDFTMEVVWFTNLPGGGTNTAGIQSPLGNEWPVGERAQFFIRTVGANRMDYWTDRGDSHNEKVQVDGVGVIAANTWYHDVLVFDYNSVTPASSTVTAYRNGSLQGSSTYNAAGVPTTLFGSGFGGSRRLAVGIQNSVDAALGDHRGVSGGVDAIAVTTGLLAPGSFVLPAGPASSVSDWTLF